MAADDATAALPAAELAARIASGALRAADVAEVFIARVEARDADLGAFAWFDAEFVRRQARSLDAWRAAGRPLGPLHGIPVALKDVIDTAGIPTQNGTEIDRGRVPAKDAAVVERLRAAGAILFGKTETAELAFTEPARTANPFDPAHTPGGSSAGSAAAVAAGLVPLAVGTQTGGSVLRPAAFCGTVGVKPSFGAISRRGILSQSPSLDTVGAFANSVPDAALLCEALFGHDPADPATRPEPVPRLLAGVRERTPVTPLFARVVTPFDDLADPSMVAALGELCEALGDRCFTIELPALFGEAPAIRDRINFAEMSRCFDSYARRGRDHLSEKLRAALEAGEAVSARDYLAALDWAPVLNAALDEIFRRCDALLTFAAPGPAPRDRSTTGSGIFNGLWTLCGTPAVSLPVFTDEAGLPMGVQVVGRRGDDARLLRTARWLADFVATDCTRDPDHA